MSTLFGSICGAHPIDSGAIRFEGREITHIGNVSIAPEGAETAGPAFDVTPADLISAIITECGILRPPFDEALRALPVSEQS